MHPDPFAAEAMLHEFGEPVDVSVVRCDGSITVRFAVGSPALGERTGYFTHVWRFRSIEQAVAFREFIEASTPVVHI
jgi:hypothetical protein